jgi:hypothetical protein
MKPRNVIPRVFLSVLILLAMVTVVQAQELEEVPASYILEKIQAGEEISLDHVHVIGALDLSNIELEPIYIRSEHQINSLGLKEELKPVESPMTITNSVFENNINFQNAWFRNPINFQSTTFHVR